VCAGKGDPHDANWLASVTLAFGCRSESADSPRDGLPQSTIGPAQTLERPTRQRCPRRPDRTGRSKTACVRE
jgi:hypothetical protein